MIYWSILNHIYLIGMNQFVSIIDVISDLVNITHSVPQETVLVPILFLTYKNNSLNLNDESNISCYANDTALLIYSNT